jgi:hypothetical protein
MTEASIRAMADEWFRLLDEHQRQVDLMKLLVPEGLAQNWPDYTVRSLGDFEGWYQRALRLFFDEVHTLKEFNVTLNEDGTKADVNLVVYWEASTWTPGDRNSKRLMMDAHQSWEVVASPEGKPLIKTINVDKIVEKEGSASL